MSEYVMVTIKLSPELVRWMDLQIAEKRLEAIKAHKVVPAPTRSSFIRDLLTRSKTNK